jgi:hypothetical protein
VCSCGEIGDSEAYFCLSRAVFAEKSPPTDDEEEEAEER